MPQIRLAVVLRLALVLLAFAAPASAQFMNRAIWLGSAEEGVRRDFRQDREYFVDRASYVDRPPWWRVRGDEPFDLYRNSASIAGGSVSSDDLTLETAVNLGVDVGRGWTFRAHQMASEHQSTRFDRYAVGFDVDVSDSGRFLFQLEGDADKENADVSLGAEYLRTETSAHRVLFTLADWSDGKSEEFEYDDKPYGVMFSGFTGGSDEVQVVYDLSAQLPFTERRLGTGTTLDAQRAIGLAEVRVPVSDRGRVVLGVDGEWTTKELRPGNPASLLREDADVERGRIRAEYWQQRADGYDWTAGFWLHRLDEDYDRLDDAAESRRVRRREAMLTGRVRTPINDRWSLEPYVIAGYVELEDRTGGAAGEFDFDGFQGKLGAPVRYAFSDIAFLRIDLSMQLDKFAFGGAGIQFEAWF